MLLAESAPEDEADDVDELEVKVLEEEDDDEESLRGVQRPTLSSQSLIVVSQSASD